jgi:hypothetical protein
MEIKKLVEEQSPIAYLLLIRNGIAYYDATIKVGGVVITYNTLFFAVPVSEMKDIDLTKEMETKLLLPWICEFPDDIFQKA